MLSVARLSLLSFLFITSCSGFQAPLLTHSGVLALRERGNSQDRVSLRPTVKHASQSDTKDKKLVVRQAPEAPLYDIKWDGPFLQKRTWHMPHILNSPVFIKPSAMNPATPTRALVTLALGLTAISLARAIPGVGNILANCFAGAVGGVAALGVALPDGRLGEAIAAQGTLKAVSAGTYTSLITLVSTAGLAGVALASLGTGVVMGMCNKAVERANVGADSSSLLTKLKTKAANGLFTENGLFGTSVGDCVFGSVVQFEAFFLSYSLLVAAFPWMGLSLAGTAVSGALSGVASLAAGASFQCVKNVKAFAQRCSDWWTGTKSFECRQIVDDCASTALKSSVLFVAYQAAYDMLKAVCSAPNV